MATAPPAGSEVTALALVRCWMDRDEAGTRALLAGLAQGCDPCPVDVAGRLAGLAGMLLAEIGVDAEDIAELLREAAQWPR
jgi:hypothetical protein